ncbi:hypothetical protein EK904_003122 [Melospiza melodia maxima]|nr:hypothetical protein EK904_003122 [Melospiza melodia maxima]
MAIHESLSYLEGKATVFHSRYLSVCANTRTAERPSPKENPTEEPEAARNSCEEESEEEVLDLAESTEETESEAPTQGEFPCRALQEYPINNMVTGYASARDMKKYEGELHDFIPGTSGYAVYWVQSKCSIYCEKAKMKRKCTWK